MYDIHILYVYYIPMHTKSANIGKHTYYYYYHIDIDSQHFWKLFMGFFFEKSGLFVYICNYLYITYKDGGCHWNTSNELSPN